MRYLTREQEARRLIDVLGREKFEPVVTLIHKQFDMLHARAQVLLTLCGIVITVTGFSGRIIAQAGNLAKGCIVGGLGMVLLSGAVAVVGMLGLKWLTRHPGEDNDAWLTNMLLLRDRKTRAFEIAMYILLTGLVLYVIALSLMLLDTEIAQLPASAR